MKIWKVNVSVVGVNIRGLVFHAKPVGNPKTGVMLGVTPILVLPPGIGVSIGSTNHTSLCASYIYIITHIMNVIGGEYGYLTFFGFRIACMGRNDKYTV